MVRIALIQMDCTPDPRFNLKKTEERIAGAAAQGAQIILLQELFQTLYFCRTHDPENFQLAEEIPGPSTRRLSELARELGVVLVVPLFERAAPGVYFNSAAVIDADGSLVGTYRKMHIPEDPGFHEKFYFTPGDLGYKVFETGYGRIGTLICWDQWYPEAARITAMMGADLLVYPTAIATLPEETDEDKKRFIDAWQTAQRGHAIANGCYVAAINRTGMEGGFRFWGRSFVSGPFGEMVAEAGEEEQILTADLDFSEIEKQRQIWPFFRDRRIDSYDPVLKRWVG